MADEPATLWSRVKFLLGMRPKKNNSPLYEQRDFFTEEVETALRTIQAKDKGVLIEKNHNSLQERELSREWISLTSSYYDESKEFLSSYKYAPWVYDSEKTILKEAVTAANVNIAAKFPSSSFSYSKRKLLREELLDLQRKITIARKEFSPQRAEKLAKKRMK